MSNFCAFMAEIFSPNSASSIWCISENFMHLASLPEVGVVTRCCCSLIIRINHFVFNFMYVLLTIPRAEEPVRPVRPWPDHFLFIDLTITRMRGNETYIRVCVRSCSQMASYAPVGEPSSRSELPDVAEWPN